MQVQLLLRFDDSMPWKHGKTSPFSLLLKDNKIRLPLALQLKASNSISQQFHRYTVGNSWIWSLHTWKACCSSRQKCKPTKYLIKKYVLSSWNLVYPFMSWLLGENNYSHGICWLTQWVWPSVKRKIIIFTNITKWQIQGIFAIKYSITIQTDSQSQHSNKSRTKALVAS